MLGHNCFFVTIFCLLVWTNTTTQNTVVYVNKAKGNDSQDCIEGKMPCSSLEYAVSNTGNNTTFSLTSTVTTVDSIIEFQYRDGVSVVGSSYSLQTLVQCNCSGIYQCGLSFKNSSNIFLQGIVLDSCSLQFKLLDESNYDQLAYSTVSTGLYFMRSVNIYMTDVSVTRSNGFGVTIINCLGEINISKSNFLNNSALDHYNSFYGGGGMLIFEALSFLHMATVFSGSYSITNCNFSNNYNSMPTSGPIWYHLSYGGGLNVFFSQIRVGKNVTVVGCTFTNNTSLGGGGMAISMHKGASGNLVSVSDSFFISNNGSYDNRGGGGGLKITVSSKMNAENKNRSVDNQFQISKCVFLSNKARYGGGVSVMAGDSKEDNNYIYFTQCQWWKNAGSLSAAADISPDLRSQDRHSFNTRVYFENCHFKSNFLTTFSQNGTHFKGTGVFLVTRLKVKFLGNMSFEENRDTAVYIDSSYIDIAPYSLIQFLYNKGSNGAAIRMEGFSGIHYDDNVTFEFVGNVATFWGGAIYSKNDDQHLMFSSHTCLFKPLNYHPKNVHFSFVNNTAGSQYGLSIYLTSVDACRKACYWINGNSIDDPFHNASCLGNFTFRNDAHGEHVTTDVNEFFVNFTARKSEHFLCAHNSTEHCILQVIPGFNTYIALRTHDGYGHKTTNIAAFYVNLVQKDKDIKIDTGTRVINNNHVKIHGIPGKTGRLSISPTSYQGAILTVEFAMIDCPPGYVLVNKSCLCSSTQASWYQYWGISGCNSYSGLLLTGFWAGYILRENEMANEDTLFTADCPYNYCDPLDENNRTVFDGRFLQLTGMASKTMMEELMCSENREGTMCGKCKYGTSVFYHSNTFRCKKERYCHFGLVFYILVDLVPITILFGVLLTLDISLTSGSAYSIIFMIQQIHALEVTARGSIVSHKYHYIIEAANVIYSFFDLEFLKIEPLSFCLWSGAQTMDILMMKYASILFSMVLVCLFVLLMNKCSCRLVKRLCKRSGNRYSVAKGLTAFLVVCYTQTTRVTFNILSKGLAYGKGSKNWYNVPFLDGESLYFKGHHLRYAIPALVFLIFIVIPLPLILIMDPVISKLEDRFCRFSQPWTKFRMKLKPLLDAFQNCFKEGMQWYAGLFFLYRFMILASLMISNNTLQYYYTVEALLIIVLTLHSIIQPFVKPSHNIIASVCFCNLVLINYLTVRIYGVVTTKGYVRETEIFQWIQIVLVCLPILGGLMYFLRDIILKRFLRDQKTKNCEREADSVEIIFNRTASDYGSFKEDDADFYSSKN